MAQAGLELTTSSLPEWSLSAFRHTDSCFLSVEIRIYKNKPIFIYGGRSLLSCCTVLGSANSSWSQVTLVQARIKSKAKILYFHRILESASMFQAFMSIYLTVLGQTIGCWNKPLRQIVSCEIMCDFLTGPIGEIFFLRFLLSSNAEFSNLSLKR